MEKLNEKFFEKANKEINKAVYQEENKFFSMVESILQNKIS